MAIKFACPTCQHAFKTDEKFAGRQATCPSCQNTLIIPNPEPELLPAVDRPVAYNPKPSRSALPPPSPPFADGELNENFNPFASPQAEDTRPSFAGMYEDGPVEALKYAAFWRRLLAWIVDWLVSYVLGLVMGVPFGIMIGMQRINPEAAMQILQVLGILVYWLYYALMESSASQATLGKMALGIKVVDLEGHRVGFGRATGRHFAKFLSAIVLGLGFLMQPFSEKKQALHDSLAGCLVIKSR